MTQRLICICENRWHKQNGVCGYCNKPMVPSNAPAYIVCPACGEGQECEYRVNNVGCKGCGVSLVTIYSIGDVDYYREKGAKVVVMRSPFDYFESKLVEEGK